MIREQVNHWILTSGAFAGVINVAAALADPSDPEAFNPVYDSGDQLHPDDVGYNVMGDLIPLSMLLGHNQQNVSGGCRRWLGALPLSGQGS